MGGIAPVLLLLLLVVGDALNFSAAIDLPLSEPISGFGFTNAFPGLTFERPVVVTSPAGETNRLFVAEKSGRIMVIDDLQHPAASVFLDLRDSTFASTEAGLLGLAFHPNYAENGRFFVYRISQVGLRDQLLEFRCDPPNGLMVDTNSQKTILSQRDASDEHNAGDLKFGPDGYLYLSLGDNGPVFPDTHDSPQSIDKGFFGGIIRIDVDSRPENYAPNPHPAIQGEYRIPQDNPFIGVKSFDGLAVDPGAVRTEFFAVGMRNPWRITFDPFTGELICGDVGDGTVEEIDVVKKGGNYGWPYMEGSLVASPNELPAGLELPAYEYTHGIGLFGGRVVIGGLVYGGQELPGLKGKYLFGDYDSGNVWALDLHANGKTPVWLTARTGVAAFGINPADGGVLVANHLEGRIERLIYRDPAALPIPRTLRELNAFTDVETLKPNANLLPYQVTNPLWSDGADKQRWIDLSKAAGKVLFNETNAWEFPAGAVFLKHFELELTNGVPASRRRVETRVLVKTSDDIYGFTYRWGNSLTNAFLVPPEGTNDTFFVSDSGTIRTQVWNYPAWDQCRTCHNKEVGYVLGFRTHQLNCSVSVNGQATNQLAWLAAQGLFSGSPSIRPETLNHLASLDDASAPLEHRVRSYLESNCMQCHQPEARSGAAWDGRIDIPLAQAHILGQRSNSYPPPMKIIEPGNLTNSFLLSRTENRIPLFQMPPLATSVVDDKFVNLLKTWILRIPDESWQSANIGRTVAEGSAELYRQTLRVSSAGAGIEAGSFFFCGRAAFGSSELSARLSSLSSGSRAGEGGVMLRQTLDEDSPSAALIRGSEQLKFLVKRQTGATSETVLAVPSFVGSRLKLVSDGKSVSAWAGDDSGNWRLLGVAEVGIGTSYLAGFVAASGGDAAQFATGEFAEMSLYSIALTPPNSSQVTVPAAISVSAQVSSFSAVAPIVAFRNGQEEIGATAAEPWSVHWTNALAGESSLTAVLRTPQTTLTSAPVTIQASAPLPYVWLWPLDYQTLGDWSTRYGSVAYLIPGVTNLENQAVQIDVLRGDVTVIGPSTNRSGLQVDAIRIASELHSPARVEIALSSQDYGVHEAALYFHDWLNAGRNQIVEFVDPRDGSILASTEVSSVPAAYLPFVFRNEVIVRVRNLQGESYVTGIFIDSVPPISVDIQAPEDGLALQQPADLLVSVSATAPEREVVRVEIWDGDKLMAKETNAPFQTVLTNILAGDHAIRAVAYGTFGITNQSDPVMVRVLPVQSAAQFIGFDVNSQGSWKGRYGHDGWWIIGDDTQLPDSVQLSSPDGTFFPFADSTTDVAGLQSVYSDSRVAACLFGLPEFSVDLNVLDGQPCTAALYFLDWGDSHRNLDVMVEGPDGLLLDQRNVSDFALGKYLLWRVQGSVRFRLASKSINAVLSGVFLDRSSLSAYQRWQDAHFNPLELQTLGAALGSADSDGDGFSNALEYYLGYDPRSSADKPRFNYAVSGGWFQISFVQRSDPPDATLQVESSTDLLHWTPIAPVAVIQQSFDGKHVSWSFPAQTQTHQFIRYSVLAP